MRVLICHPGRQHSHQLAMALAERGMLARYVTGVPTQCDAGGRLGNWALRRIAQAYAIAIDPSLVKHIYVASVLRRASRALGDQWSKVAGQLADEVFDRHVCGLVGKLRPDVVVGYETSALNTFRRAKQLGVKTVLDAASVHHRWGDRFLPPPEGEWFHRRSTRRKDAEIALADEVLTVSTLARESYLEAGVPSQRLHAIPVGADVARFRCDAAGTGHTAANGEDVRFVYVGSAALRKGIDVFRDAVGRLRAAGERFTATLIGVSDTSPGNDPGDGLVRLGRLSHERLTAELPRHDVLVLPSFFDSFGMVVAEAMACGLPAIVTENVGAKEMIAPGVNGLVVPVGDGVALAAAMKWFIANRQNLPQMSSAARDSAERYDWAVYRQRVIEFFESLYSSHSN